MSRIGTQVSQGANACTATWLYPDLKLKLSPNLNPHPHPNPNPGELNGGVGAARANAAQISKCELCKCYFHKGCKKRARASWDVARDDLCLRCEKTAPEKIAPSAPAADSSSEHTTVGGRSGRASACSGKSEEGSDDVAEQPTANGTNGRPRKRQFHATSFEQELSLAQLLPLSPEEIGGTLADGRVVVQPSGLGPNSGLGLFAGRAFKSGDTITSYSGPLIDRAHIENSEDYDTSYVLRIPNSGGQLIDGKPFADAIRQNTNNPGPWGRYYPVGTPEDGAQEWKEGAASMANDPRDARLYNSRLEFRKRVGANKALCDLAPMRAILYAARDLRAGEEIYYNYGSDKPFEKMKKEMQRKHAELQRRERDVCRSVWVPYAQGE